MTSPSFDATFGAAANHGGTLSQTVTSTNKTAGANEVMVLAVGYNYDSGSSGHITSITDGLGVLNWQFAGKVVDTTSGAFNKTVELWVASASAQYNASAINAVQTINFSSTTNLDQWSAIFAAVQGCNSISLMFDSNNSMPAMNFNATSTTPPTATFSTNQPDDLLVALTGRANSFGTSVPAGWTNEAFAGGSGGLNGDCVNIDFKSVSGLQSGATYTNASATADKTWVTMVLAFTADGGGVGPGGGGSSGTTKSQAISIGF